MLSDLPDSLQPVADKLKLNIQTATNVTRTVQPDAIVKPLANAKFLSALFAPDSLERKNNTEAIEFAPGQLVAGRVVKHTPAHPRPFDEVKTAVRERLIAERAAEAARKQGTEKLAAWKAKPEEAKGLPAAITLSREETHDLPTAVVEGVLRADASALPAFIGVEVRPEVLHQRAAFGLAGWRRRKRIGLLRRQRLQDEGNSAGAGNL